MTRIGDLGRRALTILPAPDLPVGATVLFALGAGAAVTVAVSTAEQLLRVGLTVRPPAIAGDALAAGVGVAIAVLVRGTDRAAGWVVVVRALSLAGTFTAATLAYAYVGRTGQRDPLAQLVPAFVSLLLGGGGGFVAGTIASALLPRAPRAQRASVLLRSVGAAILAGAIGHLIWPTSFFLAATGATRGDDPRVVLFQLPDLLVGPIAGGIYGARHGAGYLPLMGLGIVLDVPAFVATIGLARAAAAGLEQPIAVAVLLLALRVAAWPLAAAFANGFLTLPAPPPSVTEDHS